MPPSQSITPAVLARSLFQTHLTNYLVVITPGIFEATFGFSLRNRRVLVVYVSKTAFFRMMFSA